MKQSRKFSGKLTFEHKTTKWMAMKCQIWHLAMFTHTKPDSFCVGTKTIRTELLFKHKNGDYRCNFCKRGRTDH